MKLVVKSKREIREVVLWSGATVREENNVITAEVSNYDENFDKPYKY